MPRGKPKTPRRLKRSDETWHKNAPHGKADLFVLCFRCKRGVSRNNFRKHVRCCFGFPRCLICSLPFPCTSRWCAWRFAEPPVIPKKLVPYFRDRHKPMTPERQVLELQAWNWFARIRRTPWSER